MFSHINVVLAVLFVTWMQGLSFASMDVVTPDHVIERTRPRVYRIIKSSRRPWIEGFKSINHTSESSCADEAAILIKAIESGEEWAFQMLDASSILQSGFIKGNIRDVGMYDQCMEINEQYNHGSIQGKHCMVSFGSMSPPSPELIGVDFFRFFSSLCVPSSCNETHVEQIMNAIIANSPLNGDLEIEAGNAFCAQVGSDNFNAGEIYTLIFFAVIVVFMIACTICDFARRCKPTKTVTLTDTLAKFSLYTNALAVLSTKVKPGTLQSLQGIRVLGMCWVVLGHSFLTLFLRPMVNARVVEEWWNSWASLYILAAPFSVDTFFFISGFLTAYLLLEAMKSGRRINWPMLYLRRYLRITSSLVVIILFTSIFAHRFGNGPLTKILSGIGIENCQENWWVNLLFVQNLLNAEKICVLQSWSVAADMQLFWISPIVIYPLYRWPKHGIRILAFFLLASILTPPVILAINGYSNRMVTPRWDLGKLDARDFVNFYFPTYNRANAYFLGIFLGYDVATKKRQLTKVNVLINWVITSVLILFCACATHFNYNNDFAHNRVLEVVLALTLRPCWSIATAWIIYACTHGHGGPLNSFLSLPIFGPLSRLSFSTYLVHFGVLCLTNGMARTPVAFSDYIIIHEYLIDLALSIAVAFVFTLFFESPFIVLDKVLFNPQSESDQITPMRGTEKELQVKKAGMGNKSTKED